MLYDFRTVYRAKSSELAMDYDSHYMDRLIHTIRPMENDITEIIKQLKKC